MSTKPKSKKAAKVPASIVWFDIPSDHPEKTRKFYNSLFGWKIKKFPVMQDYWHIDTGGADASPDGGLLRRKSPQHRGITNYIIVPSIDKSTAKAVKLGGSICVPKTAVPEMGYFVVLQDLDGNTFALWERNEKAG